MALTTNQLIVGMFNMASGGYNALVTDYITANGDVAAADALLQFTGLNPQFAGANVYSNADFASALVARVMPGLSTSLQTSITSIVTNFMTANPALSRGAVVVALINAVDAIPASDPVLGTAGAAFDSRVALADASTSTSTNFTELQTVVGGTSIVAGSTITLTTAVDVGSAFTGASGNDTFVGTSSATNPTINLGDSIDGGAGTDALNITTNLVGAIPSIITKNIETYNISNSANGTLAVNGQSTAPTTVNFLAGANNTFTLSGVSATTAVSLESEAGQLTLTLDSVTGSSDALSLSLNGAKSTASVAAAGIETFNVRTTGAASTLAALTGAQGSKLVVTGDKALTITADLASTFTTIDASAATAAVKVGVATGGNVTITGGTADDRLHVVGLDSNDTINGGTGTDTLAVDADVTASNVSKVTNVEKLEFTAATTQDLSLVSATGIKTFVSSLAAASTAFTNNENTFSHVVSEATSGAFAATAALNGPADVLNVELANSDLTTLTATNYETLNLKSTIGQGTGTVTNIITTLTNSAAANIVVTGDTNLTITNAIAAQGTVDASAFTGKLTVTGSASADVIKGGSAVDTITAAAGADVVTGGAGADIFVIAETHGTDTAYDTITDFNTGGSDILRFIAADNVIANAGAAAVATTNAVIVNGKATFAAADDTLAERVTTLIAQTGINEVAFFEQGSDTFVYHSGSVTDGSVDFLVKLTGVSGLTSITESTATAGDFTIA
jgi:Ca2+-binding RTX toxin-like protein